MKKFATPMRIHWMPLTSHIVLSHIEHHIYIVYRYIMPIVKISSSFCDLNVTLTSIVNCGLVRTAMTYWIQESRLTKTF